jgi:hypothetical protein
MKATSAKNIKTLGVDVDSNSRILIAHISRVENSKKETSIIIDTHYKSYQSYTLTLIAV